MLDMADTLDMIEQATESSRNVASTGGNINQTSPQMDAASVDENQSIAAEGSSKPEKIKRKRRKDRSPGTSTLLKRQRRTKANDRERNRMHGLNDALERLRKALPTHEEDAKLTKIETLRFALDYIKCLMALLQRRDAYNRTQHPQIYPPDAQTLGGVASTVGVSMPITDPSIMNSVVSSEGHLMNAPTNSMINPVGQYSEEMTSQSAILMAQMQSSGNNFHQTMTQQQCTEISSSTSNGPLGDAYELNNGPLGVAFELNEEDLKQCLSLMMHPCDGNTNPSVMSEFEYVNANNNNNSNNVTYMPRTLPPMTLPSMTQDPPTPPFSAASCSSPVLAPNSSDHFSFPQPPTPSDSGDSPYCSPQKMIGSGFEMTSYPCASVRRPPQFNNSQFYVMK